MEEKWPLERTNYCDLNNEEQQALRRTQETMGICRTYLAEEGADNGKWKLGKEGDNFSVYSTWSPELNIYIFKIKCTLNRSWKRVKEVLLDYPGTPGWNDTCEKCATVMTLPPPPLTDDPLTSALDPHECPRVTAWVAYMRMSDSVSKMISKRDFCTCFVMEESSNQVLYVGTACTVAACPKLSGCVRGDQNVLAVLIEEIDDDSCSLTQLTSINFKGMILQYLVDMSMIKSLSTFTECLTNHINNTDL